MIISSFFWYLSEIWDYPNDADDKTIEIFTEVFCYLKTLKQELQDGETTKEEAEKDLKEVLLILDKIKNT